MEIKLLAVTITYHPDTDLLCKSILSYINGVERLILWNNSEDGNHFELPQNIKDKYIEKINIWGDGKNYGIAFPVNQVIKWGLKNGYTHILTMDQDSIWKNFASYRQNVEHIEANNIAIYSPSVCIDGKIIDFKGLTCITSGSIYPLNTFKKIGYFREDYEIDNVDIEYCYRARSSGYQIEFLPDVMFHKLGNPTVVLGRYHTPNYSTYRLFHISKNEIMLWKDYKNAPIRKLLNSRRDVNHKILVLIKNIILGEKNKAAKITAILKGYISGLKYQPSYHFEQQ